MLKKALASLALTVGLPLHSMASDVVQFPTRLACTDYKTIIKNVDKFKEKPFAIMESFRDFNGTVLTTTTLLFVNPKTKSYTMVEKFNDDLYCVVSMGENLEPYLEN